MNSKRIKVRWTEDERKAFFEAARTFGPPEIGDMEEVWRKAQEVAGLPPNRRRPLDPATAALMNKERRKGRVVIEPAVHVVPQVPESWQEVIAPTPEPVSPILPQVEATVSSLIVDIALRALYDPRLRSALRSLVVEALLPESELEQQQAITWRTPKLPKERAVRVVIAGANAKQVAAIGPIDGLDLRYWGQATGESIHRLNALLESADIGVLVTKFVSHNAQEVMRAREKKGMKVIYWNGSPDQLRTHLENLRKEQT